MPVTNDDISREQLRTRDRLHAIEGRLATLELRRENDARTLEAVAEQITAMVESDKIAVEVAARVNARRHLTLTRIQRVALGLAASVPLINLILKLAGIDGGL
jgi:hypothetical protein